MKPASLVAAFALSVAATSAAGAQKTVSGITGSVFRYVGDTIWMDRDTSETRVIYRGDTVIRRSALNGRVLAEMTLVLREGAAWLIATLDSTGTSRPTPPQPRSLPLAIATMERDMLAREIQQQEMRDRLAGSGVDPWFFPMMPSSPVTYSIAPATTMVYVRDTVLYIRGCRNAARLDTTVFQLFGEDSTRRLTAPARTFGKAMALSLISQMRLSSMQARTARRMNPPPDLPGASSVGCK